MSGSVAVGSFSLRQNYISSRRLSDCNLEEREKKNKDPQVNSPTEATFDESPVIAASASPTADLHKSASHCNNSWRRLSAPLPLRVGVGIPERL